MGQSSHLVLKTEWRVVTNLTPTCVLIDFGKTTRHT